MELWDIFDSERNPTGRLHRRCDPLKKGDYHIVVEVLTVNDRHEVLVTLRHPEKESFPGFWEITGGAAVAGEGSLAAARRELSEETGISAAASELYFAKSFTGRSAIYDIYFLRKSVPLEKLKMQEGETVAAKYITFAELDAMIDEGLIVPTCAARIKEIRPLLEDFIERTDE